MTSWRLIAATLAAIAMIAASVPARAAPIRIVSLAPSITETLFALGAGPQVVGVSQYCDYPPEVNRLPRVGSFLTPNLEAIVALKPSIVVALGLSSDRRQIHALQAMGYRVTLVNDDSMAQIEQSIEIIGRATGREDAARLLREEIRERISAVKNRLAGASSPRTLMIVGRQPMVVVGSGTYLDELLTLAHAVNIAAPAGESWPHLGAEYVIAMKPEVILEGAMGDESPASVGSWSALEQIPAVRNHRMYAYPLNPVLHPGPRVATSLEIIARLIHPEKFQGDPAI